MSELLFALDAVLELPDVEALALHDDADKAALRALVAARLRGTASEYRWRELLIAYLDDGGRAEADRLMGIALDVFDADAPNRSGWVLVQHDGSHGPAPVRGLTVGAAVAAVPVVEYQTRGYWWQRRGNAWRRWRADAVGGARWSLWCSGGENHDDVDRCRLVSTAAADAAPETRGPL